MVFRFLASKLIFQFLTWFECLTSERARAHTYTHVIASGGSGQKHRWQQSDDGEWRWLRATSTGIRRAYRMWWHVDAGADELLRRTKENSLSEFSIQI